MVALYFAYFLPALGHACAHLTQTIHDDVNFLRACHSKLCMVQGLASQKLPQGAAEAYRETMAKGFGGQKRKHSTSTQKAKVQRGKGFG